MSSRLLPAAFAACLAAGPANAADADADADAARREETTAEADAADSVTLPRLLVWGTAYDRLDVGYWLDVDSIDRTKNADFADALKQVPTVRLDPRANGSMRQGDLLPTEFSISGADTYQNRIVLQGASIDNLIDPGYRSNQMDPSRVNSNSQGTYIDTAFIENLQVLDSNISAREGGFSGGVVKSDLRGYRGETEAGFSWRTTRDAWTTMHVDPTQREQFGAANGSPVASDSNAQFQPNFRKDFYRAWAATRWNDIGVFTGYSRRESQIEQRQFSPPVISVVDGKIVWTYPNLSPKRPLDRSDDFATAKFSLLDRSYTLDLAVTYSHYDADGFVAYQQDSDFSENHDGVGVTLNYAGELGPFRAKATASVQDNSDSRSATSSLYRHYYGRPSLWEGDVAYGSYGPLKTTQRSYQASGSLARDWSFGASQLTLDFGAELNRLDFERERPRALTVQYYRCIDQETYYCELGDHYLAEYGVYAPGRYAFDSTTWAGFGELTWKGARWSHRLGLRMDHDDWLGNDNLAPRWLSAWDVAGDGAYVLQFGANRYYGKSFLSYRMQALERAGATRWERDSPDAPFVSHPMSSQWRAAQGLATPYDDELALTWRQRLLGHYLTLSYLDRYGRKQVMTDYVDDSYYRYNNAGRSHSRFVTVAVEPEKPFDALGASWRYSLTASWERRSSNQNASAGDAVPYENTTVTDRIFFEDKVIAFADLPSSDFATPKTASFVLFTDWKPLGLTWRNDVYWRSSYNGLASDGLRTDPASGRELRAYHRQRYPSGFNWDTGFKWTRALGPRVNLVLSLDVLNVLDKEIVLRADPDAGVSLFQAGRQYWTEIGLTF